MNTVIVHIDMDAFFCSVEQLDRPELRGKAVIVGGNPFQGRGVVSSASYEARRYGVHSAMPSKQAYRLCPNAIFLRPRFKRYEQFAERIFKLLEEYTPLVEPASIDEAYIDLSGTKSLFGDPVDTARKIKHRIKNDIGLPVSVGVAPNKLLAKIASDSGKPDGLVVVREDQISDFMEPLPIKALPGVGSKFVEKLNSMGVHQVKDILPFSLDSLVQIFGKGGAMLYCFARGIDDRPIESRLEYKSMSIERTFAEDIQSAHTIRKALLLLADTLAIRIRRNKYLGRTITIKVRYHNFDTKTRSVTISEPTCSPRKIYTISWDLARPIIKGKRVRLLGISVSNLMPYSERLTSLFDTEYERDEKLLDVVSEIRDKFGENKIFRAGLPNKFGKE